MAVAPGSWLGSQLPGSSEEKENVAESCCPCWGRQSGFSLNLLHCSGVVVIVKGFLLCWEFRTWEHGASPDTQLRGWDVRGLSTDTPSLVPFEEVEGQAGGCWRAPSG